MRKPLLASLVLLITATSMAFAQHRYRGGSFEGLSSLRRPADVGIVHIPCLQQFLVEQEKAGQPLAEHAFRALRAMSPAMEMDRSDIADLVARRGCSDPKTYQEYISRR